MLPWLNKLVLLGLLNVCYILFQEIGSKDAFWGRRIYLKWPVLKYKKARVSLIAWVPTNCGHFQAHSPQLTRSLRTSGGTCTTAPTPVNCPGSSPSVTTTTAETGGRSGTRSNLEKLNQGKTILKSIWTSLLEG